MFFKLIYRTHWWYYSCLICDICEYLVAPSTQNRRIFTQYFIIRPNNKLAPPQGYKLHRSTLMECKRQTWQRQGVNEKSRDKTVTLLTARRCIQNIADQLQTQRPSASLHATTRWYFVYIISCHHVTINDTNLKWIYLFGRTSYFTFNIITMGALDLA